MSLIKGLGDFQRELSQSKAFKELDGEIAKMTFNPHDPKSIEAAVRAMETVIDAKMTPFHGNPLAQDIAVKLKEWYCAAIVRRAQAARGTSARPMSLN